jgi:riboflavin transporter FmnP
MANSTKSNKVLTINNIIKIALLSALAFVLAIPPFRWTVPIFPAFLSLDVADLTAIVGLVTMGWAPALWIAAIKNVLDALITGPTAFGLGQLANFIFAATYILTIHLIYRRKQSVTGLAIGASAATIVTACVAAIFNYFVLIPAFAAILMPMEVILNMAYQVNPAVDGLGTLVIFSIIPFNLLKFGLTSVAGIIVYMAFKPILAMIAKK